ncbi:MAG: PAS domain-containing protein, partial [Myxococcota bacterium]
ELRGRSFMDFVHPEDIEGTAAEYQALLAGRGRTLSFQNRYRTKAGGWCTLDWNAHQDDDGRFHCTVRDASSAAEVLLARQRQLEQLSLSEELAQVGHWVLDLAVGAPRWSPQTFRVHGLDPHTDSEPKLEDAINFYHPEDRATVSMAVEQAIASREPFEFNCRILRADGAIRHVHSLGRPQVDPRTGEVVAVFGVFADVTDRERELARSNAELERFASAAAHDLQSPLRTIMGFGELLRRELGEQLTPEAELYLQRIVAGADRMQRLVTELFRYARPFRNASEPEPLDMVALVQGVLDSIVTDVRAAGASVELASLPPVRGRREQVESLFANLLANALKFRQSDRPLHILIGSERRRGQTFFVVRDNGRGFDAGLAKKVFGLFRQLDPKVEGMGMGLALCKRVVETHGGEIEAAPVPGEGTTFRFTLPLLEE